MSENKTRGNQSSEKLLNLLEYLVRQEEPRRLQDIAGDLDMNASTALRFLMTLVNCGYARQDPASSRYSATMKVCALASHLHPDEELRRLAKPYMQKLSELFGESVCLAVEQEDAAVYVEVLRVRNQSLMSVQQVGNAAPMYCNGIGKLFLSRHDDEWLADYLSRVERITFTEHTITDAKTLRAELANVRQNGYSFDNEEKEIGARCVAFPVFGPDSRIIAGISVTGPASRMTDDHIVPKLEAFRQLTDALSAEMGADLSAVRADKAEK